MDKKFVPSSPPDQGVYLSGLVLRNASWDVSRKCVGHLRTGDDQLPIASLKPVDEMDDDVSSSDEFDKDDIQVLSCPLVCYHSMGESASVSTVLTHLCLPTCLSKEILQKRRVHLTSTMLEIPE